jgi:predicted CopG family antitoxin
MGHRTITISDEAYRELSKLKRERESFTDVVLRLASGRGSAKALVGYLEELPRAEDLAESVESATRRTRRAALERATAG